MELLERFKEKGALLEGNFLLTSGLYSHYYMQCAKFLQYPDELEYVGEKIASRFIPEDIDVVISPAIGGVVLGTEVGRRLGVRTIFSERNDKGYMELRRGFAFNKNEKVLIVEDVVTTGGSVDEVISLVKKKAANPYAVAFIVDRSDGKKKFDVNIQFSLIAIKFETFTRDRNPKGVENSYKPGSRKE